MTKSSQPPAAWRRQRAVAICGLAACGFAAMPTAASAQDSVSRNANGGNGLPGDALSPWVSTYQRVNFVLDLAPIQTSWGTSFGVGPIIKSSKASTTRFSSLNGPACISADVLPQSPAFWTDGHKLWTSAGGGVQATENNAALVSTITGPLEGTSFTVGVLEYEETSFGTLFPFFNQVLGATTQYDPAEPSRLYVSRFMAAANSPNGSPDRSQLGLGGVDANGYLTFRGDGFGVTSTVDALTGNNIFRTNLLGRNTTVNLVSGVGASQATVALIANEATTLAVPAAIPASAFSAQPMSLTPSLAGDLRAETTLLSPTPTAAHLGGAYDHRGTPGVYSKGLFPSTVATIATLAQTSSGSPRTDAIVVSGVDASRQIAPTRLLTLPATIASACDATAWPTNNGEFRHYDSQVTFRGGSGQVAIGRDESGNALVAAVVSRGGSGFADNPSNAIAVARFDPSSPTSPIEWSLAAWVDPSASTGGVIRGDYGLDGAPNTSDAGEGDGTIDASDAPIGRIATLADAAPLFVGPSMSSPAMDANGNVYFIASVVLKRSIGGSVVDVPTIALLRAVRSGGLCYELDLVLAEGDVILGQNSQRSYRIDGLNLGDADSISSASMWSSSATSDAWNALDTTGLPATDPRHLGGLVVCARVLYDADNDGDFADPTAIFGTVDANSADEGYHVVLYVGNTTPAGSACPPCAADYDQNGGVDGGDLGAFFADFEAGLPCADVDQNGGVDGGDLGLFFTLFEAGGC